MARTPIEISELRKLVSGDTVKELADFLEEKLDIEIEMTGSEVILNYDDEEEKPFSRSHLRTLLKKFLHKSDLKDFRVIAGKENALIIKEKKGIYPTYRANRDSEFFKAYKKSDLLLRIYSGGLLDYIYDSCQPDAIVLFGSGSRGEDIENSDIDLFVQSPEKRLNLGKYEKILNRGIALFFEEDFSRLSNELKNNILNGIVLKGYLKAF